MSRNATGHVVEVPGKRGTVYALRFHAYGRREYLTLGPVGADQAQRELRHLLADVERGVWQPSRPVAAPREVPTFHTFASEWFERQKLEGGRGGGGLTDDGAADLGWRITNHLLPTFAAMRLDEITVEDVDRYRLSKVRTRAKIDAAAAKGKPLTETYVAADGHRHRRRCTALNTTSINKCLQALSAILESACEYGHVTRNVAHGRRRRLPSVKPPRTSLDRAEHISALLDAAGRLDSAARRRHGQRRALLATLLFAGLRISEALRLRRHDVDLARGTIKVRSSKTDAGVREVNILPVLRDELGAHLARSPGSPTALVFASATGQEQSPSNIRGRLLTPAVEAANKALAAAGGEPIAVKLTPHSLRRTFASLLFALGESPPYVMAQMGHTTAELTLEVYARQMDRRDGEPERLRALVEGADWAETGRNPEESGSPATVEGDTGGEKSPH